jgi:hypothetical protein
VIFFYQNKPTKSKLHNQPKENFTENPRIYVEQGIVIQQLMEAGGLAP